MTNLTGSTWLLVVLLLGVLLLLQRRPMLWLPVVVCLVCFDHLGIVFGSMPMVAKGPVSVVGLRFVFANPAFVDVVVGGF